MENLSNMVEMLYLNLFLDCQNCKAYFEFSEEATDPVEIWAEKIAKQAYQGGWRCFDDKVLCGKCSIK